MKASIALPRNLRQSALGAGLLALSLLAGMTASAEEDRGRVLFETACAQCHGLALIEKVRNGRAGWEDTVHKMVVIGAQLGVEEMELVIDYLHREHGPDSSDPMRTVPLPYDAAASGVAAGKGENIVLPAGEGKPLVESYCVLCHDLGRIVGTRRKATEWKGYVHNMLQRNSMTLAEEQVERMTDYLVRHFGTEKEKH